MTSHHKACSNTEPVAGVEAFKFYILTTYDGNGFHPVGYFSKVCTC